MHHRDGPITDMVSLEREGDVPCYARPHKILDVTNAHVLLTRKLKILSNLLQQAYHQLQFILSARNQCSINEAGPAFHSLEQEE